jgi:hypothetical protein
MFIQLTKIRTDREQNRTPYADSDDPTENPQHRMVTQPVWINAARIRCFTPRKDDRVGTRITFSDGGGFAVTEPANTVLALIRDASGPTVDNLLLAAPSAPEGFVE